MLKYATLILPLLIRNPRKNPVAILSGFAAIYLLVGIASILLMVSLFIFILNLTGRWDLGLLVVSLVLLTGALVIFLILQRPVKKPDPLPSSAASDPLVELLPTELQNDPAVAKLLDQVRDHPVGSVAMGLAAGALFGHEFLESTSRSGGGKFKRAYVKA